MSDQSEVNCKGGSILSSKKKKMPPMKETAMTEPCSG
jgi:hypothetical protein